MEEQWQSSEKEGGTVTENGKDWRNSGRAERRMMEQSQSMEKIGGTGGTTKEQ